MPPYIGAHDPGAGAGHARDRIAARMILVQERAMPATLTRRPQPHPVQPAAITSISTMSSGNASERTSTMVSAGHGGLK